jgi:hypothetical protein
MIYTYWLDKNGGFHYHKSIDCPAVSKTPDYKIRYTPVTRTEVHVYNNRFNYVRIREDGKFYFPCPLCYGDKRR